MIWSAGDLGIEIDYGPDQPGAILQRKEKGYWRDYLVDGELVVNPFDVESRLGSIACAILERSCAINRESLHGQGTGQRTL